MAKKQGRTVWVATHGSRHYDWVAAGETADEALDALIRTWDSHARDKSPVGKTLAQKRAWFMEEHGAWVVELELGARGVFQ